jgi:hypothetical protein
VATAVVPSVSVMATTTPASVALSPAPKANDSKKAVVPVDASELEKHVLAVDYRLQLRGPRCDR